MKYAFDTNIYQIWRNINDPVIKKIANHTNLENYFSHVHRTLEKMRSPYEKEIQSSVSIQELP